MEFKTEAQKQAYQKADTYLSQIFGEMIKKSDEDPVFFLDKGSAIAQIVVYPWGDDDAVIAVRCFVIYGAELVPDLLLYLLRQNSEMRFGAFGLDKEGDIFFEYSVVGSTVDKEEMKTATLAVVTTADQYDDLIKEKWGGMRQVDMLNN